MSQTGFFDRHLPPQSWFNKGLAGAGWFDDDLIQAEVVEEPEIVPFGIRVVRQAVQRGAFY